MSDDNKAISVADRYLLRNLIDRYARERGDDAFVLFSAGEQWSYQVMAIVALVLGAGIDPVAIISFPTPRLPQREKFAAGELRVAP